MELLKDIKSDFAFHIKWMMPGETDTLLEGSVLYVYYTGGWYFWRHTGRVAVISESCRRTYEMTLFPIMAEGRGVCWVSDIPHIECEPPFLMTDDSELNFIFSGPVGVKPCIRLPDVPGRRFSVKTEAWIGDLRMRRREGWLSKKILWRLTAYSSDRDCRPGNNERIYETETGRLLGEISL